MKKIRYKLEYLLCRLLFATVPWLPRRVLVALANGIGWMAYRLLRFERRVALANLDIVFRDTKSAREKERIAQRFVQNYALMLLEIFWVSRMSRDELKRFVEFDEASRTLAEELIRRGKGAVALTLHFGNTELLFQAAGAHGFPMTIIVNRIRNPDLDRFMTQRRTMQGHRLVYKSGALPKLISALRRGEVVGFAMDQNTRLREGGIWVDFFGLPTTASKAMAGLALRTGAPIVFGVCSMGHDGRYRLRLGPEIRWEATGDREADIARITRQCMAACEEIVLREPEQWMWFYRRWKFRPTEEQGNFPFYSMVLKK